MSNSRDANQDLESRVIDNRESTSETVGDLNPVARNAASLEELDKAEDKVSHLLELAAGVLDEFASIEKLDRTKMEASSKQFLTLVAEVHQCLTSKAHLIRDYTPYPRSSYGERRELELLHDKADFLRSELAAMSRKSSFSPPIDDGIDAVQGGSTPTLPVSGASSTKTAAEVHPTATPMEFG